MRAITRKHVEQMEHLRVYMMADVTGSAGLRDWVECLVRPFTEHLAAAEGPTWYARFVIQVESDPALHEIMIEESLAEGNRQFIGFPASWEALTANLVDVIVALWQAPVTPGSSTVEREVDEG